MGMGSSALSGRHRAPEPRASGSAWVVAAYKTHFRYIWALLGRLGVPEPNIEDVVQEVFLVLHRRRAEFRSDSSVRTWLHGIAIRKARRFRERQRWRQHEPLAADLEASRAPTPEAQASEHQALQLVDRLLAELSSEQREVFVLSEIAAMSAPEIGALLGVKPNTVYSRLRLARQRVRERYRALTSARGDGEEGGP
ncbi:MAG: sigma-70 family RNA polymerase sigma factor [Nannocystaceae bacterium]